MQAVPIRHNVELDNLTLGDEKTFQIRGNFKNSVGERDIQGVCFSQERPG